MQPESMEPHQPSQSRQSSNQTDTSLTRSGGFPLQNSAGFVPQQQLVAGKQNSQGGRRQGDFSKPSLRGPPQKCSRNKKDGKPKGQAAPGRSVQVYHEVVQDREVELELNMARGRKVSLNHLLNFTFQSRGDQMPFRGRNRFPSQSSHHYTKPAKYNKDQFLQANCQFIVKHDADYSVYLVDPNLLVDWTLIEQIRLRGPVVGSCPICLHPPIAAKMTRCGHIYCWPCVLHYLALSDRAWRGCPVCADPIYRKDLKSVISIPQRQYKIGEQIEFRLMCREKDLLMPHFVSQPPAEELGDLRNERGQKLVLATPQEVAEFILRREKVELETQYEYEKDEPEACFILEALTLLRDRENQQALSFEDVDPSAEISLQDIGKLELDDSLLAEEQEFDELDNRMRYTSVSSDPSGDLSKDEISGTGTVSSIGPEDLEFHEIEIPQSNEPAISTTSNRDVHYFYQAVDRQNIYLHSVNAQMLIHEYGSLEKAPRILHGKIIERDTITMTHELKNRLRYLRHLPVTTVFEVIEIDLGVPVIKKPTFDRFRVRLAEREHRRQRKDREEKRRERRILVEEEAKLGRYPKLDVKIDSSLHFPYCSQDECQPGHELGPSLVPTYQSDTEMTSAQESVWDGASPSSGPSFAQTLREGKLKPSPSWPAVKRNVTTAQPRSKVWEPDDDEELSGFGIEYQPPEAMSLSAALSAALDKAVEEGSKGPVESSSGSKKKKKKSKKLLFSTGF